MPDAFVFVDDDRFHQAAADIAAAPRIAVDIESNGFFRYPERICLVQVATPHTVYLIDPLAVSDMDALGAALANPSAETVLHAGSHDIISLDRDYGFRINALFDTQIAAAFTGIKRLGLGAVLEIVLGVVITKNKRIQRSDWTIRPLRPQALSYAADDVRHLLRLRDALADRLRHLGRTAWVSEECERLAQLRYEPTDQSMAVFNVKGWRTLSRRGLAILQALVDYRERHAVHMGRPHFRVIPDSALVNLAAAPNANLRSVRGLGRFARGSRAVSIRRAIDKGMTAEPPTRPRQHKSARPSHHDKQDKKDADLRLNSLKAWRRTHAERLKLDPALLWHMKSLRRLAHNPDTIDAELCAPEIRRWQRTEFDASIRKALACL